MTLGVLGSSRALSQRRGGTIGTARALGATIPLTASYSGSIAAKSTILPECWNQAGFKDCHGKKFSEMASACREAYNARPLNFTSGPDPELAVANCVTIETDRAAMADCGCKRTGQAGIYFGNSVANPSVKAYQVAINRDFANLESGANPHSCAKVSEDGKLGPGTCGAAVFAGGAPQWGRSTWFPQALKDMSLHDKIIAACKGKKTTAPTCKSLAVTPPPVVVVPPTPNVPPPVVMPPVTIEPEKKNMGLLALGAALVLGVGGYAAHKAGWF